MKLKAHNLTNGNETIRFVVWWRKGSGMVDVFSVGSGSSEIMSLADARAYWKQMLNHGYEVAPATIHEPN